MFFQAEDGIRDLIVTGVQTCALPIWIQTLRQDGRSVTLTTREGERFQASAVIAADGAHSPVRKLLGECRYGGAVAIEGCVPREQLSWYPGMRSEERRVGKECRARRWPAAENEKECRAL